MRPDTHHVRNVEVQNVWNFITSYINPMGTQTILFYIFMKNIFSMKAGYVKLLSRIHGKNAILLMSVAVTAPVG